MEGSGLRIQGQHHGKGFNFLVNAKARFGAQKIIESHLREIGATGKLDCIVEMAVTMLRIPESEDSATKTPPNGVYV
jgi:hypothetical protein